MSHRFIEKLPKRLLLSSVIYGDANLDGKIDGSDYTLLDNGFNLQLHGWGNGDFNSDGRIDGGDYSLIDHSLAGGSQVGTIYRVGPAQSFTTVASAAAVAQPGDTVLIDPGTYHESLALPRSGAAGHPITFAADGWSSVTIDGSGFSYIWNGGNGYGGRSFINVSGITFQHAANPLQYGAVVIGSNSTFTDCIVEDTDSAGMILQGSNIVLSRITAVRNGEDGIDLNSATNVTASYCIVANNNPGLSAPVWAGSANSITANGLWYSTLENCGCEATRTNNAVLSGWQVYANNGVGIHFDIDNRNTLVTNCTFGGETLYPDESVYDDPELDYEISYGPARITNNTFAASPGGALTVASSSNVVVSNNVFSASVSWTNWNRGGSYNETNEVFSHNMIIGTTVWWGGGNLYSWTTSTAAAEGLASDFNAYESGSAVMWGSNGPLKTIAAMGVDGIEAHGTVI